MAPFGNGRPKDINIHIYRTYLSQLFAISQQDKMLSHEQYPLNRQYILFNLCQFYLFTCLMLVGHIASKTKTPSTSSDQVQFQSTHI